MTNKELEKKLCSAFEEATPDVLGSVLADCRKEQKTMITFTNTTMSNWTKKFAFSAAAAVLVICLSLGMGNIFGGIDPTDPTEPFQTGTEPTDTQPSEPRPSGPVDEDTLSVDWSMTASVIQPDGSVVKTHPMTVKGTIEGGDPYCHHNLNIQLDEDFRFMHTGAKPDGDIFTNRWAQWPGDFTTEGFCYDKIANKPELVAWAVNTEKEYYIAWFGEEYGMYVVAATDPAVQPDEILEHFERFVERYKPTDPQPTDPQPTEPSPTDPEPTEPKPTEPTVPVGPDGFPTDMNTDADVVAEFQKLFDNDSWYTQALNEEFDDPRNISLNDFLFCDMKPWPYTKLTMEETEKLRQQFGITVEWWVDCYSMEAATVEEVLQTVFGYSMADFKESTNPYIRYLESTDCYYYGRTDSSLVWNVSVVGIRELGNGNIEVYYNCDWLYPENGFVTLKPNGDSYVIVSNSGLK